MARREWNMTAKEVFETPEWELQVLLSERARENQAAQQQQQAEETARKAAAARAE